MTKSAMQAWAESLTYAWQMAVLDHRFPPEAENSWNCFEDAMSVDNKRFDQEPELASQRIRQLEEKNKEARRLQNQERGQKGPEGLQGWNMSKRIVWL